MPGKRCGDDTATPFYCMELKRRSLPVQRPKERGVAIIMVILMIAIGMTVLVALNDSTYVAMRLNSASERRVKAEYILKSAINVALVLLANDTTPADDRNTDDWMKFTQGLEAPGSLLGLDEPNVRVSLLIASEQGKIPILALRDTGPPGNPIDSVKAWAPVLYQLLVNVGAGTPTGDGPAIPPEQLVANLIDYLDTNEDNFNYDKFQGDESSLPAEKKFRNEGKIDSLTSELAAIPGFTPDLVQRILPFISGASFSKININAAPEQVLMALDPNMTPDIAAQIIARRDPGDPQGAFTSMTDLTSQIGTSVDLGSKVQFSQNIFEVIAKVEYATSVFMASATIKKGGSSSSTGGAPSGGGASGAPRIESLLMY